MARIRLIFDFTGGYSIEKYVDVDNCYLAEAIRKRLKKGFNVDVGGMGDFYITKMGTYRHVVFRGNCPKFSSGVCERAAEKRIKFARFVEIPKEYVKRTRCKELASQA